MGAITFLLLLGCSDQKTADQGRGSEPPSPHEAVLLSGKVLNAADDLGSPGDIAVVGPHLVVIDAYADAPIRVLRRQDGTHIRSLGRRGEGPGEFEGAWSLDPVPGTTGQFWIFDIALQRATHVDLEKASPTANKVGERSVRLTADAPLTGPFWMGDSLLVSPGYLPGGGRLAHLRADGTFLRAVGSSPPGDEKTPMSVRQHAYQSTARPNHDRSLVALGTRHADRLEIYRPDGALVAQARGPLNFEPVYTMVNRGGSPSMASGEDLRFGYIDLTVSKDRIYALYSGRMRKEFPGEANFGEFVHVYDWRARLHRTLRLDSAVFSIAVDENARKLYAARMAPEPAILVYELPGSI